MIAVTPVASEDLPAVTGRSSDANVMGVAG